MAGVGQSHIHLRFAWQAWHSWHCVKRLGRFSRFTWQAWYNLTHHLSHTTLSHIHTYIHYITLHTYIPTYVHTYIRTYVHAYYLFTYLLPLSHTVFHIPLCHTHTTVLTSRSFTTSFVFPSFPVPATTFEAHYWKKLTCGVIRSFNFLVIVLATSSCSTAFQKKKVCCYCLLCAAETCFPCCSTSSTQCSPMLSHAAVQHTVLFHVGTHGLNFCFGVGSRCHHGNHYPNVVHFL